MPATAAPPSPYRLANHMRACRVDEQVVLLDLQRNKYLGVGGVQLTALSRIIVDWPASRSTSAPEAPSSDAGPFLEAMLGQRMLTGAGEPGGKQPTPDEPLQTFDANLALAGNSPRWLDMIGLARAAWVSAFWMKRRSLADIADHIHRLRSPGKVERNATSSAELHKAVSAYLRLRPFFYTAHDQCLRDSLALLLFLASKGAFPTWVIGVRTRPFAAHSWVQNGHVVLNDVHEHVREYTPILVV